MKVSRFREKLPRSGRYVSVVALAAVLGVAVTALTWLSYGAVAQWRGGAERLVVQRSEEVATLLAIALSRNMKGAHDSVLSPFNEGALEMPLYDMADTFARGFARFPYPESFFTWEASAPPLGTTYFFNRVERLPPWDLEETTARPAFPVATRQNPRAVATLIEQARLIGDERQRFAMFETTVEGVPYQVVVHHTFRGRRLQGLVGFTVNLNWIAKGYFPDLLQQVARIGGVEGSLSLAVLDNQGRMIAATDHDVDQTLLVHARTFPLTFVDPAALSAHQPGRPAIREWTAAAGGPPDRLIGAAAAGAARTFWLITIAAVAAGLGLVLTLGAIVVTAQLSLMKSEFVSSATHELKTPLAAIQLVGDTLQKGRIQSAEKVREYAGLLSEQTELLARLIDNLLAFASLSDVRRRYVLEFVGVSDLVEEALERFDARLVATGTEVRVDVPRHLPRVRVDRQAIVQVLDNVIDNAIKYAPDADLLTIRGCATGDCVCIEVIDGGIGIHADERHKVFQKFYRGRSVTTGGSGLGLAIARRVVEDHGGEIGIRSHEPNGTVVVIDLPVVSQGSGSWRNAFWWSKTIRRSRAFWRTTSSTTVSPFSALGMAGRRWRR